jgi:hypothetical protein
MKRNAVYKGMDQEDGRRKDKKDNVIPYITLHLRRLRAPSKRFSPFRHLLSTVFLSSTVCVPLVEAAREVLLIGLLAIPDAFSSKSIVSRTFVLRFGARTGGGESAGPRFPVL